MKTKRAAPGMGARSLYNFRRPFSIALGRRNRHRHGVSSKWLWWVAAWLAAIPICAALLDEAAMKMRDQWPDWVEWLALATTDFGLSGWFLAPAALVLLVANLTDWGRLGRARLRQLHDWTSLAFLTLIAVGLGGLIALFLKYAIGRARPRHFDELGAFTFDPSPFDADFASFPSGHATTAGAVTGILFLFFPAMRPFILLFGMWIAATRIVSGAHYPSDVVAGFGFGMLFAFLTAIVFARMGFIFRSGGCGLPARRRLFRLGPLPFRRDRRSQKKSGDEPAPRTQSAAPKPVADRLL